MRAEKFSDLYQKDFVEWAFLQADLLKQHRFNEIDIQHIAEEIEDLGAKNKRELYNRLIKLMSHLLKMKYQPEMICQSWKSTIHEQKKNIKFLLKENPSLKKLIKEYLKDCYDLAKEEAVLEMGDLNCEFPKDCLWTSEEILEIIQG